MTAVFFKGRATRAIGAGVLALLLKGDVAVAGLKPLTEFSLPDDLEVTLWAESPLFFKPTNIDVDSRGRIWVAEGVNYRTFRGKDANQPETIPFRHPAGDRIVILEDTDADGVADSSKVFVQDKDLVAPLGQQVCELNDRTGRMVRLWIECFNRGGIDALLTEPKSVCPRKEPGIFG